MNGVVFQQSLRELALFAGAGGGILGGKLLGWRCVCAVEIDAFARAVLAARQNDGCLEPFPIWDDVRTFDGRAWRGVVDVVSGGFPCQDISVAGKGGGIEVERSGLWREFARVVCEVRPRFVCVENSPALIGRGLGSVLGDLAALGYDAPWGVLGAGDAIWASGNALGYHERQRIWIVAEVADADGGGYSGERGERGGAQGAEAGGGGADARGAGGGWWGAEPAVCGVVDGVAAELDRHGAVAAGYLGRLAGGVPLRTKRIAALGNGQVPACVVMAWNVLRAMNNE